MKLYIRDSPAIKIPTQAHPGEDAAYDIVATTPPIIYGDSIESLLYNAKLWKRVIFIEYGTNLYVAPEDEQTKAPVNFNVDASGALCGVEWETIGVRYHTQLFPRSSISKYNLVLANSVGTIDNGYRDQIFCRFKYLFQPEDMVLLQEDRLRLYGRVNNDHLYQAGDKIIQIKACANTEINFERVKELPPSSRKFGGFGSSGK